jgi:XRE family aerobic/anaerobic benzoate catabolism transcriptional regulator
MTRRELAERARLSARFIAQLEGGRGNISVGNLAAVADALHVPPAALLAGQPQGAEPGAQMGDSMREEIAALLGGETPERLRALLEELRNRHGTVGVPAVIALLGLRGAGKSTVGPLLARSLGLCFLELDDRIQDETGLAVGEIFELHGEDYYRLAEGRALRKLVEKNRPVVVAVSGGIVTDPRSFDLLRERTLLVWLQATPDLHMARVRSQGDRRPMRDRADAMAELRELLETRKTLYAEAPVAIDTSEMAPGPCALRLAQEIARIRDDRSPARRGADANRARGAKT